MAEAISMHGFWYLDTIVVADDDVFTRTIKSLLKLAGFGSITIARDLHELRRNQARRRHDLIVADGELASLDGSDLALLARADPLLAPALLIIVTWDVTFSFHEICMRRGADAVIYKPVSADGLATALTGLLTSRRGWRGKIVPHPSSFSAQTAGSADRPGSD
jgi:CheY-like chemotaxis protein